MVTLYILDEFIARKGFAVPFHLGMINKQFIDILKFHLNLDLLISLFRLVCIEEELSEQKRSQDKITRLCQAAIKALERIEDKPIISTNGSECSTPILTSKER